MTCSPTADGATLKKGRLYVWDAANTVWLDQANPIHTHSSTTEGGFFSDMLIANDPYTWKITETDMIYQSSNGSGYTYANTVSGSDAYRSISTGTTTNAAATMIAGGLRYDFAYKLFAHFRAIFSTVTDSGYTTRIGFNMEHAHVSSNASKKLGIEACDTCNGSALRVVSADDSTRSATNIADLASTAATYKLVYNPTVPNLSYFKNNGSATVKTSNMFNSGSPNRANVFIAGIKPGNTTSKTLQLWGAKCYGTINAESTEWV
jgi:hypothetical protein